MKYESNEMLFYIQRILFFFWVLNFESNDIKKVAHALQHEPLLRYYSDRFPY